MRKITIFISIILLPLAAFAQDTTLTVTSGGNVGIGETAPDKQLHLGGVFPVMKFGTWSHLGTGQSGYPYFGMATYYDGEKWITTHEGIRGTILRFLGNKFLFSSGPANSNPAELTDHLTINAISGNVGIGTTAPRAPLSIVKSNSKGAVQLWIHNDAGSAVNNSAELVFGTWVGAIPTGIANPGPQARIAAINMEKGSAKTDLAFSTYSATGKVNEVMRITNSGNVGIGTTAPAAKLHVAGGIKTQYSRTVVQPLIPDAKNTITHNFGISGNQLIFVTNGHYEANPFLVGGVNIPDITPNSFTFNAVGGSGGDARINFIIFIR